MPFRSFAWSYVGDAFAVLLPYVGLTLLILLVALLLGLVLGFLLCLMLLARRALPRLLARTYLTVVRGAPAIVLLFLVYYGLPGALAWLGLPIGPQARLSSVIVTFALIAGAQSAYILLAAYRAIPAGQIDAATASGYSRARTFFSVLLPQGLSHALPNLMTMATALLKEGAVAYKIGLVDVVGRAQLYIASQFGGRAVETYLALTVIFFTLIRLAEAASRRIERMSFMHLVRGAEHAHG